MIHGRKKDVFGILPTGFGKSLIFQIVLRFTKEKNDGPGHNASTTYNVKPLFSRNKEIYVSKEVKENALASEGKSCQQETITAENQYACHILSVWNKRQEHNLPAREKIHWDRKHFGMR